MAAGRVTSAIGIYSLAARKTETAVRLDKVLERALKQSGADKAYLIVPTKQDRHHIQSVKPSDPSVWASSSAADTRSRKATFSYDCNCCGVSCEGCG